MSAVACLPELPSPDELLELLGGHRFRFTSEAELQNIIEALFLREDIPFEREVRLSSRDRIDFMVGATGLEVKIGGSASDLTRQVFRYLEYTSIDALIIVVSRHRLKLPEVMRGKRVLSVNVGGAFA